MLFHFDLSEEALASIHPHVLNAVIPQLVDAHRRGNHLIVISRVSAAWLRESVDLSLRDRAMLDRIAQEYAQTGALYRNAAVYVKLSHEPSSNLTRAGNAITVSVERLPQYRLFDRSVLVIENLVSDGAFYYFLLHNHCDLHGCSFVAFDLHHGGGETTGRVFEHQLGERRIVCGVVDSDRNAPTSPNHKLATLQRIKLRLNWPLAFAVSPPCREAENMVPFALVTSLPAGVRNATNAVLLQVESAETAGQHLAEERYWLFFDIKEGLSVAKFVGYSDGERSWIGSRLRLANIDPYTQDLGGYGDRVFRQILDENRFLGELRRLSRQASWRRVFHPFLEELIWPLIATRAIVT